MRSTKAQEYFGDILREFICVVEDFENMICGKSRSVSHNVIGGKFGLISAILSYTHTVDELIDNYMIVNIDEFERYVFRADAICSGNRNVVIPIYNDDSFELASAYLNRDYTSAFCYYIEEYKSIGTRSGIRQLLYDRELLESYFLAKKHYTYFQIDITIEEKVKNTDQVVNTYLSDYIAKYGPINNAVTAKYHCNREWWWHS